MSNRTDYDPNHLKNFDRTGRTPYEPAAVDSTKAPYVLLAILALIGLVGGALYFSGVDNPRSGEIAIVPETAPDTTLDRPAEPPGSMTSPPLPRPNPGVTPPNQVTPGPSEQPPAHPE